MKSLLTLFVIGVACGFTFADDDFAIIDSIHPEKPCNRAGGVCTIATDCPAGQLAQEKGLCPKQRSRGVECCHGVSIKETRCRKNGGECMENCSDILKFKRATDCPESKMCCILVV